MQLNQIVRFKWKIIKIDLESSFLLNCLIFNDRKYKMITKNAINIDRYKWTYH